jgi:hypothetical protein
LIQINVASARPGKLGSLDLAVPTGTVTMLRSLCLSLILFSAFAAPDACRGADNGTLL